MDDSDVRELASRQERALLRYAYLLTGSRQDAEDLVQEAYAKVLRHKHDNITSLPAYMRRIILNDYRSAIRRATRGRLLNDPRPPPFEDRIATQETVWRGLMSLPKRQRAVLVLRFYERMPDDEIANVLDCQRSSVRSLASRAIAALRQHPDLKAVDGAPTAIEKDGR